MTTPQPLDPPRFGPDSLNLAFGEMKTGQMDVSVYAVASLSCTDDLDPDRVTFRCALPLNHDEFSGLDVRALTQPMKRFVALGDFRRDQVWWAGPIMKRRYSAATGMLELAASGMFAMFDRRPTMTDPTLSYQNTSADIHLTGLTLRSIAAKLVRYGTASDVDSYTDGTLPISIPVWENETGTHERHYYAYDLAPIGDRLRELMRVSGGPDMHFRPAQQASGPVLWGFRAGSPIWGKHDLPHVFESGNNLLDVEAEEDGSRMVSKVAVPGDGNQRSRLIGTGSSTELTSRGWPYLWDVLADHSSTKTLSVLNGYGSEYVRAYRRPIETWRITVNAFGDEIMPFPPGNDAQVRVTGDPWLGTRTYNGQILGWTYDGGETVTVSLAPTPGQV